MGCVFHVMALLIAWKQLQPVTWGVKNFSKKASIFLKSEKPEAEFKATAATGE